MEGAPAEATRRAAYSAYGSVAAALSPPWGTLHRRTRDPAGPAATFFTMVARNVRRDVGDLT